MVRLHRSFRTKTLRPSFRRPASTQKPPEKEPQPEPIVLKEGPRSKKKIAALAGIVPLEPVASLTDVHRKPFQHVRNAILSHSEANGPLCLNKLEKKGTAGWVAVLTRFLELLMEMGHIVIDYATRRVQPVHAVTRRASANFYDGLFPSCLSAATA